MALDANTTAIVTGASGGIGSEIVNRLRALDIEVAAVSIRDDQLARLEAKTGAKAVVLDVSDADAVDEALGAIEADLLINAAGALGPTSAYKDAPADQSQRLVNVNILGIQNCLRAVLPGMCERNRGHVVNFGSVAGHYPSVGQPIYSATKAAVHMMTLNLRMELFGTDIRVSEIIPGRVRTGMHAEMFSGDRAAADAKLYDPFECLTGADVADAVLYVVNAPPHVDITQLEIMPTHHVLGGARFHRRES